MLLFMLFLLLINKLNNICSLQKLSIENLYNNCKTGDIIFFRYKSVKLLDEIFSKYTHVGLVVELNDKNRRYIINNCLLDRIYNNCIRKNTNKKFCSEFVMFCLYELKIVENDCSHCVFPNDFLHLMSENNDLLYDTPILIDLKTKM